MKISRMIAIALVIGGLAIPLAGCASKSASTSVSENQVATVQRGNLTVAITASGNLALSVTEDLAFEVAGYVQEVTVEEGQSVEQGQVLATLDTSEWDKQLINLKLSLLQAELALEQAEEQTSSSNTGDIVSGTSTDPMQIEIKEMQVELAKEALAEALDASPEITAPFDGFITAIDVKGGDEVYKGTVAMTIADPNKFEVDVLVSEMDISQVKAGGAATVEADAAPGIIFPAKVTYIAPTATISSGVVNYKVTVEVESLEEVAQEQQTTAGTAEGLPSEITPPEDFTPPAGQVSPSTSQAAATSETMQLRQGLTVTVSIIVAQASNVLLVPNGAITTQRGQSYVQVLLPDGTIEKRAITTGITDYVNTEVTSGLSEGEQVLLPGTTTTTTPTTSQQGRPGGAIFFGG
jgi:macrolide-specific efflux system membrane fusion protein